MQQNPYKKNEETPLDPQKKVVTPVSETAAPGEASIPKVEAPASYDLQGGKELTTAPVVRWLFEADRPVYWQLYLFLSIGTAYLFLASKPPAESPLISSYLDVLDQRSQYAIPEIVAAGGNSFWLSFVFIIFLTALLCATFLFCRGSYLEAAERGGGWNTRRFGLGALAQNGSSLRVAAIVFSLMLIANAGLFYFYARQLDNPGVAQTSVTFRITYFVAILSRLFGLFLGLGALLQLMLQDFWSPVQTFFRSYRTYFYPPLLAIAIVAFVFTRVDQFDSLFIDLVTSPWNFLLFSLILFPASIIIIWFTPSYLLFTDRQFVNRVSSWDILHRLHDRSPRYRYSPKLFAWTVLHKRLFPQLDRLPGNPPPAEFMPAQTERVDYPTASFDRFRALLAVLYILTLVNICARIYFGNMRDPWVGPGSITLTVFVGALLYTIYSLYVAQAAYRENTRVVRNYEHRDATKLSIMAALRERPMAKRSRRKGLYLKRRSSVVLVRNRRPFFIGLVALVLAIVLFLITLTLMLHPNVSWETTFPWFMAFLCCTVFSFTWLALFQSFFGQHTYDERQQGNTFPNDGQLDRIDHLNIQAMLLFNPLVASMALAFFAIGLFNENVVAAEWVAHLNPLNIYLLLINGAIAGIILLDRYLLLRDRRKQYRAVTEQSRYRQYRARISTANFFWGMTIIGAILAMTYLGNSYHEIQYHAYDRQEAEAPTLDAFVERFVADTSQTGPVIFVASDGGGLKACYWTMLNLLELDRRGLYLDNVFALSGASGGTIGIAMYDYLKARGIPATEIRGYIERIGERNFLSGDFAGLLTRFPINYWPDIPGLEPHRWDDRMESMARAYFRIVGDGQDDYRFDKIRYRPYWQPWLEERKLPLLIANTARSEDGLLGTVVPLRDNPLTGTIDLSRNANGEAISYPDATFLSNRFPLASPTARITGKGHFVDAGNADNSGIGAIYSLLRTMKSREVKEKAQGRRGPYTRLFERKIVVLSLRNAVSRYVRDIFLGPVDSLMNRYPYKSEASTILGAAVNTGLTGVPIYWDDYLRGPVPKQLGLIDTFLTVNLPFRLRPGDVYASLGGELKFEGLKHKRDSLNTVLYEHLGEDFGIAVMPPLGRLLAEPTRRYMDKMVTFPPIKAVHDGL